MLASVIAARGRKYLMMNAPSDRLPGARGDSCPASKCPSVIPLAHAGMIAIHSVVDADDVWALLPRLQGEPARPGSSSCRSRRSSA